MKRKQIEHSFYFKVSADSLLRRSPENDSNNNKSSAKAAARMQHSKSAILMATVLASAVMAAGAAPSAHASPLSEVMGADGGLIIPAYGWESDWDAIIDAKEDNDDAEFIVVINPSAGPGGGKDGHWSAVAEDLQDAGIKVIGYISTAYGGRSAGDVKEEIRRYFDWYDLDGVFIDEQSASSDQIGYYEDIYDYAKDEQSDSIVVSNPGAPVPEGYMETADIILVYENSGLPGDVLSGWMGDHGKNHFGVIPYGLTIGEGEYDDLRDQVGYVYAAPDSSWMGVAGNLDDQADWAGD